MTMLATLECSSCRHVILRQIENVGDGETRALVQHLHACRPNLFVDGLGELESLLEYFDVVTTETSTAAPAARSPVSGNGGRGRAPAAK